MEKLKTIQTKENLNNVFRGDNPGPGGAYHDYLIASQEGTAVAGILFQKGPRHDPASRHGVIDSDLLEIVRDRLTAFQNGQYACDENARALMYVEQALIQLNMRVENRIERGVLGTMEK